MAQLQSVINSKRLVALEMRDFEKLITLCTQFFTAWDGHMQEPHGWVLPTITVRLSYRSSLLIITL
jgi:hypothetical protein